MNTEWAIEQLDDFIKATAATYSPSPPGSIGFHSYDTVAAEDYVVKRAHVVEQILDRVVPGWRGQIEKKDRQKWSVHYEASIRAREALVRAEEVGQNRGEGAPDLSAAKSQPWVWSGAKSLGESGHYREAVEGAIKKLNAEAQNKVGRRDVSGTDLFKPAFSLDSAAPGKAGLRRMPLTRATRTSRCSAELWPSPRAGSRASATPSATRLTRCFRSRRRWSVSPR